MTIAEKRAVVDAAGNVTVPVGVGEAGTEVIVLVRPAAPVELTADQWSAYVERTAGSIDDPTFVRPPQGDIEERQSLD